MNVCAVLEAIDAVNSALAKTVAEIGHSLPAQNKCQIKLAHNKDTYKCCHCNPLVYNKHKC